MAGLSVFKIKLVAKTGVKHAALFNSYDLLWTKLFSYICSVEENPLLTIWVKKNNNFQKEGIFLHKETHSLNHFSKSAKPKISVVSFCLNSGKYLRETLDSVFNQSFKNIEFILKDGGSTDETLDILKEYPQVKWVSGKESGDNPSFEALWQAFNMSRGEYLVYLAISDGISDPNWFKRAVAVLDSDREVSWVWGVNQGKSEDGHLGAIPWQEYFRNPPPQKMNFLPFWFALQHAQETNAVWRRDLFEKYFPKNDPSEPYRFNASLGFNLRLNRMGYLGYFLPIVSFYGYTHENQRQQVYYDLIDSISRLYTSEVVRYRKDFLSGRVTHLFRDGASNVIHEVRKDELPFYRRKTLLYRLRYKIRRDLYKLVERIDDTVFGRRSWKDLL